ncbi:hypothetical protein BDQ17DRAFT_1433184 [Cyathus striatus]|nr:hypothetical protein BDQ17DRAFT_1433184 [Cyathus striatus]
MAFPNPSPSNDTKKKNWTAMDFSLETSQLHALLVGIDNYAMSDLQPLQGAVQDAMRVRDYLFSITNGVGQRPPYIQELHNSKATRKAIIQGMDNIINSGEIRKDDPIVIYFAGHGGHTRRPELKEWPEGFQNVQMILPYDTNFERGEWMIEGITDVELGGMLQRMAVKWGNNITVILDCCFSGPGTHSDAVMRGVQDELPEIHFSPQDLAWLNEHLTSHPTRCIMENVLSAVLRSHVLLAACHTREGAFEESYDSDDMGRYHSGCFTNELLKSLKKNGTEQTHLQLIKSINHLPHQQHPRCESFNALGRVLFDGKIRYRTTAIKAYPDKDYPYIIHQGQSSGIAKGFTFTMYQTMESALKRTSPLATLVAKKVTTTTTSLAITKDLLITDQEQAWPREKIYYVVKESSNYNFLVYIELEDREVLEELFRNVQRSLARPTGAWAPLHIRTIELIDDRDSARMLVGLNNTKNKIVFATALPDHELGGGNKSSREFWPLDCEIDLPASGVSDRKDTVECIQKMINSASHYDWHLYNLPEREQNNAEAPLINIQYNAWVSIPGSDGQRTPRNLIPNGLAPYQEVSISVVTLGYEDDISVDDINEIYGFEVTNISPCSDVYLKIFYFDHSTFEIQSYTSPNVAKPCLKPGDTLYLGYHSKYNKDEAMTYFVPPEKEYDIGYIKVYVSNHSFDLDIREGPVLSVDRHERNTSKDIATWTTYTIKLIQKRI